jgi:hypothetical protein
MVFQKGIQGPFPNRMGKLLPQTWGKMSTFFYFSNRNKSSVKKGYCLGLIFSFFGDFKIQKIVDQGNKKQKVKQTVQLPLKI